MFTGALVAAEYSGLKVAVIDFVKSKNNALRAGEIGVSAEWIVLSERVAVGREVLLSTEECVEWLPFPALEARTWLNAHFAP